MQTRHQETEKASMRIITQARKTPDLEASADEWDWCRATTAVEHMATAESLSRRRAGIRRKPWHDHGPSSNAQDNEPVDTLTIARCPEL